MSHGNWPVTVQTLEENFNAISSIVERWRGRFQDAEFLDQFDAASAQERADLWAQYINEMKVVASYAATIVEIGK